MKESSERERKNWIELDAVSWNRCRSIGHGGPASKRKFNFKTLKLKSGCVLQERLEVGKCQKGLLAFWLKNTKKFQVKNKLYFPEFL